MYDIFCTGPTTCPEGKEYQECGTACPLTCDNFEDGVPVCITVCVEGCFCPDGLVEYRDGCVESSQCPSEEFESYMDPFQYYDELCLCC